MNLRGGFKRKPLSAQWPESAIARAYVPNIKDDSFAKAGGLEAHAQRLRVLGVDYVAVDEIDYTARRK